MIKNKTSVFYQIREENFSVPEEIEKLKELLEGLNGAKLELLIDGGAMARMLQAEIE